MCDVGMILQDFWGVVQSDPRGESVDKGNMKLAFDSVSDLTPESNDSDLTCLD